MRTKFSIAIVCVLAACAVQKMPTPSQANADRAAKRFPGVTLAELKMLYEQTCGKCHELYKPETRTEMEWMKIVPAMAQKARIDEVTQSYIQKYTVAMSKPEVETPH